ncbi:hypothetical protein [Roseateles koreensis]|uniref:hypothetical protein n=1 Tax=Roseateles koreensis TaxID=2987526 RepID=UPI002359E217|nr:hypothetical protein [Roseateles koreensis]
MSLTAQLARQGEGRRSRVRLGQCLILALLLHVWLVLLIGNAPGGTAAVGEGVWGRLNVTLSGPENGSPQAEPSAEPFHSGPPGRAKTERHGGTVRSEAQSRSAPSDSGAAQTGPWAPQAEPTDAATVAADVATDVAPAAAAVTAQPPTLSALPEPPAHLAPTPLGMPQPAALDLPMATSLPQLPPLSSAPRLQSFDRAPAAAVERLAPYRPAPIRPVDAVVPLPSPPLALPPPQRAPAPAPPATLAPPMDAVSKTTRLAVEPLPQALPQAAAALAPLPPSVSVPAPAPAPAPTALPTSAPPEAAALAASSPVAAQTVQTVQTAQPSQAPQVPQTLRQGTSPNEPRQAPAGRPEAGDRLGHDVATAPSAPATVPSARTPLNLSLPTRPRGGPLAAQASHSVLDLLPQPPERKSKLEEDLDKAGKQDCRQAYADKGLLAALPLAADAVRGKGCRW